MERCLVPKAHLASPLAPVMSDQPTDKPDAPVAEPKTEQPANADQSAEEPGVAAPAPEAKEAPGAESKPEKSELNGNKEESKAEGMSTPSRR